MTSKSGLAAPCGLYCGVCAVYVATRDNNEKFREKLTGVYGVTADQLVCDGCLAERTAGFCKVCTIKSCCAEKRIEGCHQCKDFPCAHIEKFPIEVGKKVIMRSIPRWRELGTEKWMAEEEKRYTCPFCGFGLFRGAKRCRNCGNPVDLD